jgi:hypothetical protein
MTAPRTWRSWYCGISFGCCAARPAVPSSPQATGFCSPPPAAPSPDSGGHRRFWSRPRRYCAGTAHWSDTNGSSRRRASRAGRRSTRRSRTSSCAWPGRTPAGAACGSAESCASSASGWAPRPSGRCCDDTASARRHDGLDRHGRSSSKPKPQGSWPATSSRWRRSGSRPCTCCSSSSSAPGGSSQSGSGASRLGMGHPAGQECCDGPGRSGSVDQVPAPRP